ERGVQQRQSAAQAVADDVDARLARERGDGPHATPHDAVDVVLEIREAVFAARRSEVGDEYVVSGGRDVARERATGQQVEDEIAAHGRGHEQHGRPSAWLTRLVEQPQQTQLVLAIDDGRGGCARAEMSGRRENLVQPLDLRASAARQREQRLELALAVGVAQSLSFLVLALLRFLFLARRAQLVERQAQIHELALDLVQREEHL